jgi:putative transposase
MTVRYHCRRPDDAGLRERLRALAHERRRFGYRRLHVLLRREGFLVNHKRLFRIYREERLIVRRRSAALRSTDGSTSRTAVTTAQQGITDRQTPISTG